MDLGNLFKNFQLDAWYKAFVYLGIVGFIAPLFVDTKAINGIHLLLLSLGFFFFGIGEWKNYKTATWFKPPNAYTGGPALMSAKVRKPDMIGVAFDILGVLLAGIGLICIIVRAIRV
jgi:hypothetical protein